MPNQTIHGTNIKLFQCLFKLLVNKMCRVMQMSLRVFLSLVPEVEQVIRFSLRRIRFRVKRRRCLQDKKQS
jgi:hypothetical protein